MRKWSHNKDSYFGGWLWTMFTEHGVYKFFKAFVIFPDKNKFFHIFIRSTLPPSPFLGTVWKLQKTHIFSSTKANTKICKISKLQPPPSRLTNSELFCAMLSPQLTTVYLLGMHFRPNLMEPPTQQGKEYKWGKRKKSKDMQFLKRYPYTNCFFYVWVSIFGPWTGWFQ